MLDTDACQSVLSSTCLNWFLTSKLFDHYGIGMVSCHQINQVEKSTYVVVVVVFFTFTDRVSTVPSIIRGYNPVRGLLDRKRSEEHLQSSNESKTKTKKCT